MFGVCLRNKHAQIDALDYKMKQFSKALQNVQGIPPAVH